MWNVSRLTWLLPLLLLSVWLISACTGVVMEQGAAPAPAATDSAPAVDAAGVTANNLRQQLARQLQVDPAAVEVVAVEAVEWPDACLGAAAPGEMCAQVVTPGYKITLAVAGETYTYHTDAGPYWMRLVSGPEPAIGEAVIAWTGSVDNGSCQDAEIGPVGVAFGYCGGPKFGGKFASPARAAALAEFAARYGSFEAETEAGKITFTGAGAEQATDADQLRLARWAQFAVMEAAAGIPTGSLAYYGPEEVGSSDPSKCAFLMAGGGPEATLGACDGTAQSVPLGERNLNDLQQMADRFAPFVYETPSESLQFDGMGAIDAGVWQPAILAWARARYGELASGKVSAAGNTVVSWDLGKAVDNDASCMHLTVLAWGYAYAELRPCAGGDVQEMRMGWLETAEMESLAPWLYDRTPLNLENGYIAGSGAEPMTEAEIAEARAWSAEVWQRIWEHGTPPSPGATSAQATAQTDGCPAPAEGEQQWRDDDYGYCVLYPDGYVVEQTLTNTVNIVLGSIMNHTDPRVSIEVTEAGERTLEAVRDEIVATYGGFDETISPATVGGEEAIVVDGLPGQDLNRRVAVIHDGKLYSFFFTPLGEPGDEEGQAKMEAFYQGVMGSFRFL